MAENQEGMPAWLWEFGLFFGLAGLLVVKYVFNGGTLEIIVGGAISGAIGGALHYFIFQRKKA